MDLLASYQHKISSGEIIEDPQQLSILQKFQVIADTLSESKSLFSRFSLPPKGLYLWGGVGLGKTFLMDIFYHCLPIQNKYRTHFLPFMQEIQAQLQTLQGTRNPLSVIAKQWAKKTSVICFDELAVNDIADALILAKLLEAFFEKGICMIFTSNQAPDNLYKNGIQRALFLPAIEKIKEYTEVLHLTAEKDYRINGVQSGPYYLYPLTAEVNQKMESFFKKFTQDAIFSTAPLMLFERLIPIQKTSNRIIWFKFSDICGIPRNQADYLNIAQHYDTILISDVFPIRPSENDLARSFIQLIDILYEARIRLIISAALPIESIYREGKLAFEFKRTCSRLTQMQTEAWRG